MPTKPPPVTTPRGADRWRTAAGAAVVGLGTSRMASCDDGRCRRVRGAPQTRQRVDDDARGFMLLGRHSAPKGCVSPARIVVAGPPGVGSGQPRAWRSRQPVTTRAAGRRRRRRSHPVACTCCAVSGIEKMGTHALDVAGRGGLEGGETRHRSGRRAAHGGRSAHVSRRTQPFSSNRETACDNRLRDDIDRRRARSCACAVRAPRTVGPRPRSSCAASRSHG